METAIFFRHICKHTNVMDMMIFFFLINRKKLENTHTIRSVYFDL